MLQLQKGWPWAILAQGKMATLHQSFPLLLMSHPIGEGLKGKCNLGYLIDTQVRTSFASKICKGSMWISPHGISSQQHLKSYAVSWVVGWGFMLLTCFSRKTFRRRVLQKIVGVSHTTHIPHISSTFYISHTYPFQTYPPHISHTYPAHCTYPTHIHSKRIPHIRIPSVRIHAMRIHSKGCNTYPTNHHQYPIHIQHIIHIPHISIPNVSIPNGSHQYVSIANVSIQKVCISRNRKRIPPIHIPPIRIFNTYPTSTDPFNAYPFKKFASAGMALSMSITAYHFIPFIPLLLGGNGNEYKNLAFPSILCKIIN